MKVYTFYFCSVYFGPALGIKPAPRLNERGVNHRRHNEASIFNTKSCKH